MQLLPQVSSAPWFDPAALAECVGARHGSLGATCATCGIWRWLPVPTVDLPPAHVSSDATFVASEEWFDSGHSATRELRFARPLAEALLALNPQVWRIQETGS